ATLAAPATAAPKASAPADTPPALPAEREAEAPAPSRKARPAKAPPPPAMTTAAAVTREDGTASSEQVDKATPLSADDSRPAQAVPAVPTEPADRLRQAAGVLAITAGILGFFALSPTYATVSQGSYSLGGLSFTKWYVILGAIIDLVAGACLLAPRTRRLIGPGILLGNVAVSTGGLATQIVSLLTGDGFGGGFWIALFSSLGEVSAVCVAGVAVARTPEIRLPHWPTRTARAWMIILLGVTAAVSALFYARHLSAAGWGQYWTLNIWTAVAAVVVPLIATSVVPARFAAAVLGGWTGANVAVFSYYVLLFSYESGQGYDLSPIPVIWFGLALAALVVLVVLFALATVRREA